MRPSFGVWAAIGLVCIMTMTAAGRAERTPMQGPVAKLQATPADPRPRELSYGMRHHSHVRRTNDHEETPT